MPRMGTVNYHVHKPERQAFRIDADGVPGRLVSPELVATRVSVKDLRTGEVAVSFARDGVAFANHPTSVGSFATEPDWAPVYDSELADLLTRDLGVRDVVVFDHTIREDDPASDRKPARNVHSDYSRDGAEKRLVDILGEARASEWSKGRYAFINVWRPLDNPINSAPLGFIRPSGVAGSDWILLDLIYPDRRGQILGLAANDNHEWVYSSCMKPDELFYFNIFDSCGLPSVAHSAVDLVEDPDIESIRRSIESRTLVRY
ncbi:CmcJ/NvfI family oxidoreductase [Roseibium sp. AS2]|uniref:CmcJ/NvfI family oxidoreductase n=1 Tax=Roseibium sp. AS2 TaxID=3135781 RepID=UPI0031723D07